MGPKVSIACVWTCVSRPPSIIYKPLLVYLRTGFTVVQIIVYVLYYYNYYYIPLLPLLPHQENPLCGNDGVNYRSHCHLQWAECTIKKGFIGINHEGRCERKRKGKYKSQTIAGVLASLHCTVEPVNNVKFEIRIIQSLKLSTTSQKLMASKNVHDISSGPKSVQFYQI